MSSPRQESDHRPRAISAMSFTSNSSKKSHRSSHSRTKSDLSETSKDKRHLATKADPTLAMSEAQPSAIALEASNLGSLRNMQFKDVKGNLITDPDLSNPTRSRMERPLETIRSFEEAIDGHYSRRQSTFTRPESRGTLLTDASRRNSYFSNLTMQGHPGVQAGRGYHEGGYYGSRNNLNRPDSFIDQYGSTAPQFPPPPGRGPRPNPRNGSDPMLYGNRNQAGGVYPSHAHQQSYDTVNTGSGSHQTDPWGNSTDPSSENSSLDRIQQFPKQENVNDGYGQYINFNGGQQQGHGQNGFGMNRLNTTPESRPMPPPKTNTGRTLIKLDSPVGSPLAKEITKESTGKEKRKSFFKRFSRS